jgi:hypothetical protein
MFAAERFYDAVVVVVLSQEKGFSLSRARFFIRSWNRLCYSQYPTSDDNGGDVLMVNI